MTTASSGQQYHIPQRLRQNSRASEFNQRMPLHKTAPDIEKNHAVVRKHADHVQAPRSDEKRSDRLPRARNPAQQSRPTRSRVLRAERPQSDSAELRCCQQIPISTDRQYWLLVPGHLEVQPKDNHRSQPSPEEGSSPLLPSISEGA